MLLQKVYWKVRDLLVAWGVVAPPRFYLRRHPAGTVRNRLCRSAARHRSRRRSLAQLLS